MIPHHDDFGRHWLNRHHYLASSILVLFLLAILSVVFWWQMDNFKIELPAITHNNQNQNNGNPSACIQVIAWARHGQTGEIRRFPTPCDVPESWEEIDYTANLVSVRRYGGLCMTGMMCEDWTTITQEGNIINDAEKTGTLTSTELSRLKTQIASLDFDEIKSTEFTGTCPIAFDGQESVYMFYDVNNTDAETLPSCEFELNENTGVFKTIRDLMEKYIN